MTDLVKTSDDALWISICDSYLDREEGVAAADKALAEIRQSREIMKRYRRGAPFRAFSRWFERWGVDVLVVATICAACSAIGYGFAQINPADHYAHVAMRNAGPDAMDGLHDYYQDLGTGKIPFLILKSVTKSTYLGTNAYKVLYSAPNNKPICVFVWRHSASANSKLHKEVQFGERCLL